MATSTPSTPVSVEEVLERCVCYKNLFRKPASIRFSQKLGKSAGWEYVSYQGTPSGVPKVLCYENAFWRWGSNRTFTTGCQDSYQVRFEIRSSRAFWDAHIKYRDSDDALASAKFLDAIMVSLPNNARGTTRSRTPDNYFSSIPRETRGG